MSNQFDFCNKLLHYASRLGQWQDGGIPMPISAQLDVSNACDNACAFCNYPNDGTLMDYDRAIYHVEQIKEVGCESLVFSGGGEQLLHPDILEIMEYAVESQGLEIGLITNGQQLIGREWMIPSLVKLCQWIRISVSATNADIFKEVRGVDRFCELMVIIKELIDYRNHVNPECMIGILCVYNGIDTVYDYVDFALGKLPSATDYLQIVPDRNDISGLEIQKDFFIALNKLREDEFKNQFRYIIRSDELLMPNFGKNYQRCYGSFFRIFINAHEELYLCCHQYHNPDACLADLTKHTLFDVIHQNKTYRKEKINSFDTTGCVPMCRLSQHNRFLTNLKKPVKHWKFL